MIDQSTIGLSNVKAPHHGGHRDKAGHSGNGGKDHKSFGDLVNDVRHKADAKADAQADAADDSAVDGEESKQAVIEVARPAAASTEGRVQLTAGLQQFAKGGSEGAAARQAQNAKFEVRNEKAGIKKDPAAMVDAADAKNEAAASPSEELSLLLGLSQESEGAVGGTENSAEKPAVKTARQKSEDGDDRPADDAKAVRTEEGSANTASAVRDGELLQRSVAAAHAGSAKIENSHDEPPADDGNRTENIQIVSGDGKGRPVDVPLAKTEGEETSGSQGGKTDFVTVLESRRYLGFSSDSNAAALTNAVKADSSWAEAIRSASVSGQSTATEVNTLKLQMNPGHLGNMTASLRLKGEELSVDVRVETVEAYRQLSNDQDGILRALKDQGFSIDQVTIQLSPSAKADVGQDSGNQAGNGQDLREGQGENARQRDENARRAGNQNNWMNNEQASSFSDSGRGNSDSGTGDIYL